MATAQKAGLPGQGAEITAFGQDSPRKVPFKVVVVGLGRTGTTSMKTALDILGFPAYHSTDLWMDKKENVEKWNRAIDWKYHGKGTFGRQEFDEIMAYYMSALDAPAGFFAAELAEAYPDAKVVILNRDPDSWFRSCLGALGHRAKIDWRYKSLFFWDKRILELATYMTKKQDEIWGFEWEDEGAKEKAVQIFHDYYNDCRTRIAPERVLEYRVQDGWEPLCKHLGIEVPNVLLDNGERVEVPFPRTNEAEQFRQKVGRMREGMIKRALMDWSEKLVFFTAAGYGAFVVGRPVFRWATRLMQNQLR